MDAAKGAPASEMAMAVTVAVKAVPLAALPLLSGVGFKVIEKLPILAVVVVDPVFAVVPKVMKPVATNAVFVRATAVFVNMLWPL